MSERKLLLIAIFVTGMAVPGIPAVWFLGAERPFLAVIGSVVGALAVRSIVRLVNTCGDSHYPALFTTNFEKRVKHCVIPGVS